MPISHSVMHAGPLGWSIVSPPGFLQMKFTGHTTVSKESGAATLLTMKDTVAVCQEEKRKHGARRELLFPPPPLSPRHLQLPEILRSRNHGHTYIK